MTAAIDQKPGEIRAARKLMLVLAFAGAALIFGVAVVGLVAEARELLREGGASFLADAAKRIAFGAAIAMLTAAPYLLVERASRKAGPERLFVAVAVLMLLCQAGFMIYTIFFVRSSTAAIGLMFVPLYLFVPAVIAWIAATVARGSRQGEVMK